MKYVGAGTTPSSGPTSGIETWKRYVLGRWRGMDLGSFGVRNMRGSDQLSVHAVGRAWDWRYADPGPGRAASDEAISFAIANYETLGIQAIHDYIQCQIWRCDRSGRGPGWKTQKAGNGMGDPSAKWLHWEVHPDAPLHWNTVEELLPDAPKTPHPPTDAPALPQPTLKRGDSGQRVAQLQRVLNFWLGTTLANDGQFGARTETAVKEWQRRLQPFDPGPIDGRYGPMTQAAAAASYPSLTILKGLAA
jgi:Putative peptidoglycan binding domain